MKTADSTHSRTVTKSLSADVTCLQSSLGSKGAELSTCEVLLCYLVFNKAGGEGTAKAKVIII